MAAKHAPRAATDWRQNMLTFRRVGPSARHTRLNSATPKCATNGESALNSMLWLSGIHRSEIELSTTVNRSLPTLHRVHSAGLAPFFFSSPASDDHSPNHVHQPPTPGLLDVA